MSHNYYGDISTDYLSLIYTDIYYIIRAIREQKIRGGYSTIIFILRRFSPK